MGGLLTIELSFLSCSASLFTIVSRFALALASTWLDAATVADEICEAVAGIERCPDFSWVEWHGDCDDTTGYVSFGG